VIVIRFQVCDHEEYLELDVEDVEKLLSRDDLDVENEEDVFHLMMKWIDHDIDRRQQYFSKLLKCLRLTLIAVDFLKKNIEPRCDDECKKLLSQAYRWHATTCDRQFFQVKRKNETMLGLALHKCVSESPDFT